MAKSRPLSFRRTIALVFFAVLLVASIIVLREHWQLRSNGVIPISSEPPSAGDVGAGATGIAGNSTAATNASRFEQPSKVNAANAGKEAPMMGSDRETGSDNSDGSGGDRGSSTGDSTATNGRRSSRGKSPNAESRHPHSSIPITTPSAPANSSSSSFGSLPKHCDLPWVRRYVALHAKIMQGRVAPVDTRYLLVRPHAKAGLGNRMRAIFGALSLAVLTDRALLLDFGPRSNTTEVGFFTPALVDWRLPEFDPRESEMADRTGLGQAPEAAEDNSQGELSSRITQQRWAHNWSPFLNEAKPQNGRSQAGARKLRRDGVVAVWNNKEEFFRKATPKDLWPHPRVVVMASQNHDMSKSLFLNKQLSSLLRNADITVGASSMGDGDFASWHSCALRVLFKPGRPLARQVCRTNHDARVLPGADARAGASRSVKRSLSLPRRATSEARAWRPLLALHLRSEGRHALNASMWNSTVAVAVTCARTVEERLLEALSDFRQRRCIYTKNVTALLKNACDVAVALSGASGRAHIAEPSSGPERRKRELDQHQHQPSPLWLVMADQQELVDQVRSLAPDRVVALDTNVRVHSGLEPGGEGRIMGSAFGPLMDLLSAGRALGLVGTAGSSFSQLAASIALEPPTPWARVLMRTPFIKSHQGDGMKVDQALHFCASNARRAGRGGVLTKPPGQRLARWSPWGAAAMANRAASKRALDDHIERALLAPPFVPESLC